MRRINDTPNADFTGTVGAIFGAGRVFNTQCDREFVKLLNFTWVKEAVVKGLINFTMER